MKTITPAQMERRASVSKAKAQIERLSLAITELKLNTMDYDNYAWNGDWNGLAKQIEDVAELAENMARNSRKVVAK